MSARGHKPWSCPWRGMRWLTFCLKCGLVYLSNAATLRAIRARCPGDEDGPDVR